MQLMCNPDLSLSQIFQIGFPIYGQSHCTIMDSVRVWFCGPSFFFCLEKLKCLKVKIDFNLYKNVLYIPGVVKHLQLFLLQIWIFPSIEIDWNLSARKLDKALQAYNPSCRLEATQYDLFHEKVEECVFIILCEVL